MNSITKFGVGVGVLVLRDAKILLGLRDTSAAKASSDLNGEGTWTMPGGKIDLGERLVESAIRELKEETGLTPTAITAFCVQDDITDTAHYTTVGFKATLRDEDEPQVMEPDEIGQWRWFSLNNLPPNLYLPSKKMIEKYQADAIYT
jgi:ADP-ribose pyrophosphatase YjhB (NUDIX family)